jgi:hypothetical protein
MEYTLYSPDKDDFGTASSRLRFSQDGSCSNYSPPSIETPYGMLGLSVVYRKDLSAQVRTCFNNCISTFCSFGRNAFDSCRVSL